MNPRPPSRRTSPLPGATPRRGTPCRSSPHWRRLLPFYIFHFTFFLLLPACVAEGPPSRSDRTRAEAPRQPADLPAGSVVLTVSQFPEDTDADGYADSILATAHLFSNDPRYPLPIAPAGSLRFFLLDHAGRTLADWTFDPAATAGHRVPSGVGVGHVFRLDLAQEGAEHIEPTDATLRCEFLPQNGGAAVRSRGGVTIALGPVR